MPILLIPSPATLPPRSREGGRRCRSYRASFLLKSLIALALCVGTGAIHADELSPLWQVLPGDRPYITTGNTERGVAFNPARNTVLVVSRAAGTAVAVLDARTGEELRMLNTDGIAGGTFALSMIGVTDDGVIYAANLSTSTTAPNFKIYRWANDNADTVPTIAFEGDPAGVDEATGASKSPQRWGDSFDVRGSGANTMLVAASRNTALIAIFTTTDGVNFTAKTIANAASSSGSVGVAFGAGNTVWTKVNGQPLRHVEFDLAAGQGKLLKEFGDPAVPTAIGPIGVNPVRNLLGGIAIATPDTFRVFDISSANDITLVDSENLPTDNANGNGVGSIDFGAFSGTNVVYVLDTNNGILAYRIVATAATPPTIASQPVGQTILAGATAIFTVTASGTGPFRYQWQFNGADLSGATNAVLTLTNVQASAAGNYKVTISNSAGSVTSAEVALTVNALPTSDLLKQLWRVAPGDRPYVATDNNQRGLAYNPKTGNVLLVSRTGGVKIYVLDGATGRELRQMNTDPATIAGGTFTLNLIGVADDGAVYGANLVTDSSAAQYAIYRWESDSADAVPTVAYVGDPSAGDADAANRRFGDSFDVRGSGANTQILAGSRNGKIAAVFTTANGTDFTANIIVTDAAAGDFGLGVAFGNGNSFWGKAPARPLRSIDFDLATGAGTTRHNFGAPDVPGTLYAVAFNGTANLLAGIAVETPDNVRLYDLAKLPAAPILIDQEVFGTDNANANGTGALDFGGGNLYALDTNNGLIAFAVGATTPPPGKAASLSAPSRQANGAFVFTVSGAAGATYAVQSTVDFKSWTPVVTVTIGANGTFQVTDSGATGQAIRFYRVASVP